MKVNNSSVGAAELAQLQKSQDSKASKEAKNNRASSERSALVTDSSRPEISQRARELAQAKEAANAAPDVREDLIADLKSRIASGKYNVSSEDVADRLVDEHISIGSGAGGLS